MQLRSVIRCSSKNSTIKLKDSTSQLRLESSITGFNGTLKIDSKNNNSVQASSTETISFVEGVVSAGASTFTLTGTYNPSTSDTIQLNTNDTLDVAAGNILQAVTVGGTAVSPSSITGQPVFTNAIVINGATNYLKLGIQNNLSQNVTLNGGTLELTDNLILQNGVKFSGNGTVDIGNYSLGLDSNQSSPWTGILTLKNARDIKLNGYTALSGEWNFSDLNGISYLNGNGNVLDLSTGGIITVAQGHTLYLADVHLRGLGSGLGSFNINNTGGVIKMSNVTMELNADYSHNSGLIYIQGDRCRVISANTTGGNFNFNISGTGTKLTVDHAILEYETLSGQNISPFSYTNLGVQQNLINSGIIRSATLDMSFGNIVFDSTAVGPSLSNNHDISSQSNFVLTNSLGGAQTMILDGGGYYLQFPDNAVGMFQIANDLTVRLENIALRDFNYNVISYGANSALQFGDGCTVELDADTTLDAATKSWTFVGNAILNGHGHTINLNSAANRITIENAKTLTIRDAKININHVSALSCLTHSSKIILKDVEINVKESGYTFALGNMDVSGNVKFKGCNATVPDAYSLFTYSTTGTLTVQSASNLMFDGDINFTYQAAPAPGATPSAATYSQSKRKIRLIDPSSVLHLNGCTLTSTNTALALDYGRLVVEDRVNFNISSSAGAESEFGTSLEVLIKSGATLEVAGPLKYIPTVYP